MIFEWDEAKRRENIEKRGIDFIHVAMIFADPDRIEARDTRKDYGEDRRIVLGNVQGTSYVVAYTLRGDVRRIITAWKVDDEGKKRYQALLARRAEGDE